MSLHLFRILFAALRIYLTEIKICEEQKSTASHTLTLDMNANAPRAHHHTLPSHTRIVELVVFVYDWSHCCELCARVCVWVPPHRNGIDSNDMPQSGNQHNGIQTHTEIKRNRKTTKKALTNSKTTTTANANVSPIQWLLLPCYIIASRSLVRFNVFRVCLFTEKCLLIIRFFFGRSLLALLFRNRQMPANFAASFFIFLLLLLLALLLLSLFNNFLFFFWYF